MKENIQRIGYLSIVNTRLSALLLLFLLLSVSQTITGAQVRGIVSDLNTKEVLIGSTLLIKELKSGTNTGLDGTYRISNIPAGHYTLVISYIGYISKEIEITVKSEDEIISQDVELASSDISIDEVTITAFSERSSDKSARLSEKMAPNILNIVSARTIELSPDLTIANVIQRVSGVNLEKGNSGDDQYATLRGMDKRYNYTLINGIKIPSTNNKYRYLPLNIFPSDLVDRLEVTKALTADMEADAIGGAVNMVMKDAPDKPQIRFNFATGYEQMYIKSDFTGFDPGDINKKSPYELNGSNYYASENDFPKSNLVLTYKKPLPLINTGFSAGSRFFDKKLGIILAASLSNSYKGTRSEFYDIGNTNDEYNLPKPGEKEDRVYSNNETILGIHNKIDYSLNRRHRIKLYNAFIMQKNDQVRESVSLLFNSYTPGIGNYTQDYHTRMRHRVQNLFNTTLQGEHLLTPGLSVNWSAAYSKAGQQTPDNVTIALVSDFTDYVEQEISVIEKASTRRWERNTDNDISGYLDLHYNSEISGNPFRLSAGGMAREKDRTSFYNRYRLIPVSDRPPPFQNFSQKGVEWDTFDEIHWQVMNPPDPTHALNYNASENTLAAYTKAEVTTGKIDWNGGIRIHSISQGYILHYEQYGSEPIGENIYTDVLPSLLVKYRPDERQNIRASYFKGINLPGFLEIVPYIDKSEEYDEGGNPELNRCIAHNFDLRYEFFPKPLDQVMVGMFYKRIIDPIEYSFTEYAATQTIIYIPKNFGTAGNLGFEVDYIKHFRNFAINSNYTWTKSNIGTDKILPVRDSEGNLKKTIVIQDRPLFGQSEHIANLSVIYKNLRFGWDVQIAAAYFSERIAIVSQYLDNDVWDKGSAKLDVSMEKKLGKSLGLFIKVNNLLNTPREQYIKLVNPYYSEYPGQDYDEGKTLVRRDFDMQSYLIGIRYKFN
jgi:outer membrane cobalamin receptor